MDIQALELVYEYPVPAVGKTEPVEVIDLLGGVIRVAVDGAVSGWTPAYAALKNSGIWDDSPLQDGRQLTAAASGNVVETIACIAHGTQAARAAAIARLVRVAQAARDFHTEDAAYRPVYIRYRAAGAPAEQYALIYNIEVDVQQDPFGATDSNPLTLTIEREPFWRAIKPLDDPRQYTKQTTGTLGDLISATISNFDERNNSFAISRVNYVDIPAATVKGSAPALCQITLGISPTYAAINRVWVARDTIGGRHASGVFHRNTMTGTDATLRGGGVGSIVASAIGLYGSIVTGLPRSVLRMTLGATYTSAKDAYWTVPPSGTHKYLVFVRGRLVSGSYSTLTTQLRVLRSSGTAAPQQVIATLPFTLGANYGAVYAGIVDYSAYKQMIYFGSQYAYPVQVEVYAATVSGAATFDIWDVVFIPFDEYAISADSIKAQYAFVADNTGHVSGGSQAGFVQSYLSGAVGDIVQARGQMIELEPNQNNRLYFMFEMDATTAAPTQDFDVDINIVPRWHGVRDAI